MPLTEQDRDRIESFRTFIADSLATDDRYGPASPNDREDHSTLATRFSARPSCWFEVAVRPFIPQVRVGFLTDDRWKSEELEQAIQDSGDTMQEFIGVALEDAGQEWPDPPVEHYREGGTSFCLRHGSPKEILGYLDSEKIHYDDFTMGEGYLIAF